MRLPKNDEIRLTMKKNYTVADVAKIIRAEATFAEPERLVRFLVYDSRKITDPSHALFFALMGDRDGHDFINNAYQVGVRDFVVEENRIHIRDFPDINLLEVKDTLTALQLLAAHHRSQFNYPVIGITGSNGKTVVKEWLNQLLSPDFSIVRSPKSFNSQIGVALSLWEMSELNDLAIIEAGISKPGEMAALWTMIHPDIGILTNVRQAHRENFISKREKLAEKMKLFEGVKILIYSPRYVSEELPQLSHRHEFTWSWGEASDLEILECYSSESHAQIIKAIFKGETVQVEIPFEDVASIENAIICWSVMLTLGVAQEKITARMKRLVPVKMRLELKNGINNCSVIDDSYSCDVSSLAIALDFLHQQNQHQKRTVILSDIPEIGSQKETVYTKVAHLIQGNDITRFIGIGTEIAQFADKFDSNALFFVSTEAFISKLPQLFFQDESILLKGARKFAFEKISRLLSAKTHETSLEINLNAVEHNLKVYKGLLGSKTKIMVMVKAFSYGSGSFEIANVLQFNQVDYLAVAYTDEGVTLRKAGITLPIMVMNPDSSTFESLIEYRLEPEIFSLDQLKAFISALNDKGLSQFPIHIKVETGMNRLGFDPDLSATIFEILEENNAIRIASVFSHLAASGNPVHDDFTRKQILILKRFSNELTQRIGYTFITHIANTAAISRFPDAQLGMVRLGIGLYGINSTNEDLPIQPVSTLKTSIAQIKNISPDDSIGYNRKGKLANGGKIATVKIGYADGYNRRFGNGVGKMMVNHVVVPTIGDICMDMCMLDVSGVEAREGDEVIVFGITPRIEELADLIGTIPYELLTGISQRVKRIYFYE